MSADLARAARRAIVALHRRLLPATPRVGWIPYLWLFWLISFAFKWFFAPIEPVEFSLALLTLPVFLGLYFNGYWHSGPRVFVNIFGILLIALVWTPFNPGAITFFVFAGAFVGTATRPPRAYFWLAGMVLLIAVEWLLLDLSNWVLLFGGAITTIIGSSTIYFEELDRQGAALRLSQAEVRRLATIAERERIGRDLHDLLGHTLSLIIIKAELAAKLTALGDRRAEQEIREVERISRGALREIREAVTGFRRTDLQAELASAQLACQAADIRLTVERSGVDLPLDQEKVMAMCLREAITNVVRHADASQCRASLVRDGQWARLTVEDDGRGGTIREGAGLAGMRDRVEQAGGEIEIEASRGVTLTVRLPAGSGHLTSPLSASGEAVA